MMDKNFIVFLLISTAVLFTYSLLIDSPKKQPSTAELPPANQAFPATPAPTLTLTPLAVDSAPQPAVGELKEVQTGRVKARVNSVNGVLESYQLIDYAYASEPKSMLYDYVLSLFVNLPELSAVDLEQRVNMVVDPLFGKASFFKGAADVVFVVDDTELKTNNRLVLKANLPSGLQLVKIFQFVEDSYLVQLTLQLKNPTQKSLTIEPVLDLGTGNQPIEAGYNPSLKQGASYLNNDLSIYDADELPLELSEFDWIGIMDRYFVMAVKQPGEAWSAIYQTELESFLNKGIETPNLVLQHQPFVLEAQKTWEQQFDLYLGPKQVDAMRLFDESLTESLDLVLAIIAQPMLSALRWYHTWVNNWGLAIIVLTITVRILLLPLAYKGMKSMKHMSKLSPRMKVLREKYKDNKERLNKEMALLYKRNKVNPVGGCLPLIAQIPIFIALYWALLPAIELRHQPFFFWIQDLSVADHTLVLPLLMGVSMFIQQRITPMAVGADPAQQMIMRWLPLVFVMFFLTFPSGLVLYWLVSNIITIIQQWLFNQVRVKDIVE